MRARFFEQHASHGKAGGSGLGTYSAALIARAHGGAIAMESGAGSGTSVRVTLPPA